MNQTYNTIHLSRILYQKGGRNFFDLLVRQKIQPKIDMLSYLKLLYLHRKLTSRSDAKCLNVRQINFFQ